MTLPTVAALFVDPKGVYAGLDGVEVWDEARDARLYAGPWPVVAHPPCGRWCKLAPLNESQYGLKVGDDGGCFEAALEAVHKWGGVIEHPAGSLAWREFMLPAPTRHGWSSDLFGEGIATEIDQSAYGHPCRKRTWLYAYRVAPLWLDWRMVDGASMVSDLGPGHSRRRGADWQPGVQYAEASATPLGLATELVALARTATTVATPDTAATTGNSA